MNISFHFIFLLFLSFFVLSSGKDILEYSIDDLEKALLQDKQVVVLFYAPWCPHCKRFIPQFKQIANSYSQYPDIQFAKVSCPENREFCRSNLIYQYPTLRLFNNRSLKPLIYEGPRRIKDIVVFISYYFNAPTTPAEPIKLVKQIDQEEFSMALDLPYPTVVLVQSEVDEEENTKAMTMINHLADIYLIEPSIHFRYLTPSQLHSIDELTQMTFKNLPTFLILFHHEIAVFQYVYDEYKEQYLLSEDSVIDFINDYANTDVTIRGSRYTIPGRIPQVDSIIKKATAFDEDTVKSITEAVLNTERVYTTSKRLYLKSLKVLKDEGMDGVWKTLSELRQLIRKVEDEELGVENDDDSEEEGNEEEDENGELESLEDLEELVLYRNVLRSFAKDIPVGPFEKTSPVKEQAIPSNEEIRVGEEEL